MLWWSSGRTADPSGRRGGYVEILDTSITSGVSQSFPWSDARFSGFEWLGFRW